MDLVDLAKSMFGSEPPQKASVASQITAYAASDSANGLVEVWVSGELIEIACSVSVKAGQNVLVTLVNRVPIVTGVIGWGDEQSANIGEAKDTAQAAKDAAALASEAAAGAVGNAVAAIDAADKANALAQSAAKSAEVAATKAGEAQAGADAAKEQATDAMATADSAITQAGNASTTAKAAKADAEAALDASTLLEGKIDTVSNTMEVEYARKTDITETESALQSQISQNAAEIKTTAKQLSTVDETANNAAEQAAQASEAAKAAQTTADGAKASAQVAQSAADAASGAAAAAQNDATAAAGAAKTAQAKADKAATDLATAEANLAKVTTKADATAEEVAAAQTAVDAAKVAADQAAKDAAAAQSTATTAKTNAATAQKAAESARSVADAAKSAANAAQQAADAAQSDVDALAVRMITAETSITQNANAIKLAATKTEVAQTLKGYYTITQVDAAIKVQADRITSAVSETTKLGTRVSTVEQTASGLSVSLGSTDKAVAAAASAASEAKSTANTANSTANTAKTNAAAAQTTANTARTEAANAAKTATNYMEYTSAGLDVGNKSSGKWAGTRTRMGSTAFQVLDAAGTVLASYGASLVELGKNAKTAVIKLCGGLGTIAQTTESIAGASVSSLSVKSSSAIVVEGTSAAVKSEGEVWVGGVRSTPADPSSVCGMTLDKTGNAGLAGYDASVYGARYADVSGDRGVRVHSGTEGFTIDGQKPHMSLGTNPISSAADDTIAKWVALGNGSAWFTEWRLGGQPAQYGFVQSIVGGSDVFQVWHTQNQGPVLMRSGNAAGWAGAWRSISGGTEVLWSGTLSKGGSIAVPAADRYSLFVVGFNEYAITGIGTRANGAIMATGSYDNGSKTNMYTAYMPFDGYTLTLSQCSAHTMFSAHYAHTVNYLIGVI